MEGRGPGPGLETARLLSVVSTPANISTLTPGSSAQTRPRSPSHWAGPARGNGTSWWEREVRCEEVWRWWCCWQVRMIECSSKRCPPRGCLQYFTGPTGTISSFNYRAGCTSQPCTHLQAQRYTVSSPLLQGLIFFSFSRSLLWIWDFFSGWFWWIFCLCGANFGSLIFIPVLGENWELCQSKWDKWIGKDKARVSWKEEYQPMVSPSPLSPHVISLLFRAVSDRRLATAL